VLPRNKSKQTVPKILRAYHGTSGGAMQAVFVGSAYKETFEQVFTPSASADSGVLKRCKSS
jgi:enterochelin esterase-like enzyme